MHITLLGTGLLGAAVTQRLLTQGHCVTVWNRSHDKSAALQAFGAHVVESAAEAIAASEVTLLFLAERAAIEAVLFAPNNRSALAGRLIVQMGTISPSDSLLLAEKLAAHGADYAECPVLGSLPEAKSGSLILMFGGTEAQFTRLNPLLASLGSAPRHIGAIGQAAALKLAMNQLIAAETAAFAASLALVQAHGVQVDDFMQLLRGSALYAPTFDKKLERMLSGNFSLPNFPLDHLIKDVQLFIQAAHERGIDTRNLQSLNTNLRETAAAGHGQEDYSVLQCGFLPKTA